MADLFSGADLVDMKAEWEKVINGKGGVCPCCKRWGKVYVRPINLTMAKSFIWLAFAAPKDDAGWINVPKTAPVEVLRTKQFSTLRWWGLIEQASHLKDTTKKHVGLWRLTPLGRAFATGYATVPEKAVTYAGEVVRLAGKQVSLKECAKGYDYSKVMAAYASAAT